MLYKNNIYKSSNERKPVKPYKNIIPSKIKLEEKDPSIKYFIPASIEYNFLLLKAAKTYKHKLKSSININIIKKFVEFIMKIHMKVQLNVININSKLFIELLALYINTEFTYTINIIANTNSIAYVKFVLLKAKSIK